MTATNKVAETKHLYIAMTNIREGVLSPLIHLIHVIHLHVFTCYPSHMFYMLPFTCYPSHRITCYPSHRAAAQIAVPRSGQYRIHHIRDHFCWPLETEKAEARAETERCDLPLYIFLLLQWPVDGMLMSSAAAANFKGCRGNAGLLR